MEMINSARNTRQPAIANTGKVNHDVRFPRSLNRRNVHIAQVRTPRIPPPMGTTIRAPVVPDADAVSAFRSINPRSVGITFKFLTFQSLTNRWKRASQQQSEGINESELAAWTALGNVLLNLNETITNPTFSHSICHPPPTSTPTRPRMRSDDDSGLRGGVGGRVGVGFGLWTLVSEV